MDAIRHMPRGGRLLVWSLLLALAAFTAELTLHAAPPGVGEPFEKFAANFVFFGAALLCAGGAVAIARDRLAWALFAVGLLLGGLGDL